MAHDTTSGAFPRAFFEIEVAARDANVKLLSWVPSNLIDQVQEDPDIIFGKFKFALEP